MAMRCFGRARFATGAPRALALIAFRAVDLAVCLRGGDFFCAAALAAAREVGFCLAIDVLPFAWCGGNVSTDRASEDGLSAASSPSYETRWAQREERLCPHNRSMQPEHAVDGA